MEFKFKGVLEMFTSNVMSIGESIIISGLGLTIVFMALVILAVLILIFSRVFEAIIPKEVPVKTEVKKAAEPNNDEEYAVLVSAIHEEMRSLKGKFRITSIKEVK